MHTLHKLNGLFIIFIFLIVANLCCIKSTSATGISINAGLTPAVHRWIVRSQIRFMERNNDPTAKQREMNTYMFPVVVAYGLRPDLTIMIRQAVMRQEMSMMGKSSTSSGFADLLVMGKYRLVRINKPNYTIGIAPILGLEFPTGKDDFTSNSYDLRLGALLSGRVRSLGIDLNITYIWNGMAKKPSADYFEGDEFSLETAVAYQFGIGSSANFALAPVIETSFQKISADHIDGKTTANTGESIFLLSPGIKITWFSFVLEGLIQFPVWQNQNGLQTERNTSFLLGIKLMN